MSNEVEIIFKVDAPGGARAALKNVDSLMNTIGASAVASGKLIDNSFDAITNRAQKASAAIGQFNQSMLTRNRLASLGPQGEARSILPSTADTRFDAFKKDALNTDRINAANGATEKLAASSAKTAANMNKFGAALAALPADIPLLGQLTGAAGGIGLLVTAASAIGMKLKSITDSVRESYELAGKLEAKRNVNMLGLTGDKDQSTAELQKLRDIQAQTAMLAAKGAYHEIRALHKKELGDFMTDDQIKSRIIQASHRTEILGGETRTRAALENITRIADLQKKSTEDLNTQNQKRLEEQERGYERMKQLEKEAAAAKIEATRKDFEAFKTAIDQKMQLNSLFNESAKLRAGLGGEDLATKNAQREQERGRLLEQIQQNQGPGGDDRLRRDALSQYSNLGQTSVAERLELEARERDIRSAQESVAGANTSEKRIASLEGVISATSNIGSLSSEQIAARLKALEDLTAELAKVRLEQGGQQSTVVIKLEDQFTREHGGVDRRPGSDSRLLQLGQQILE